MQKSQVVAAVDLASAQLKAAAAEIFANPELGFEEVKAAALLTRVLEDEGFTVEHGIADLPTAFRATWKGGEGPNICIMLEYDALPGIGHACGHNLIATAGLGGAIALRRAWGKDLPGTLTVMGCPAEEGGGGKVFLVERGAFEGVDAAMMFHPGDYSISYREAFAANRVFVKFHGKKAHVGRPWDGLNALDAMIQLFVSVNFMRQHFKDGYRLAGIIKNGGEAANVVPDLTEAEFTVRALVSSDHRRMVEELVVAAEAAAKAHGCTMEWSEGASYKTRLNSRAMCNAWDENLASLGVTIDQIGPDWTPGCSDVGNVSHICPTIHPYVKLVPPGTAGHSPEFKAAAGSPEGQEVMLTAAKALAMTAVDLFTKPDMLAKAKADLAMTPR